ncbi:MAG TPA: DUF1788 domain-containing protein [Candidatus Riflebacteria bacterium]|nr:DUF1788 domain-containing protein [Candidatus Riflebacteria bacterium]
MSKEKLTIQQRFQHLLKVLSGKRFLQMEGIGKEVPFYICSYEPEEALEMERLQKQLANKLELSGIKICQVNLYDLAIELLKARGIWEQVLETELCASKAEILKLLQNVLDPQNHLIPAIGKIIDKAEYDILFINGVGEVFPFIRSHNVLNNLQSTAKEKPTLMFFPGRYTQSLETGASLDLFGRLHDDKYYRAFNIFHCEA